MEVNFGGQLLGSLIVLTVYNSLPQLSANDTFFLLDENDDMQEVDDEEEDEEEIEDVFDDELKDDELNDESENVGEIGEAG